jgi:hypothetical protein
LNVAKSENNRLKNSLVKANTTVKESFDKIIKLNKDIDALKEWGVIQQAEASKWLEKYNKAIKRYHRLKWICSHYCCCWWRFIGSQIHELCSSSI